MVRASSLTHLLLCASLARSTAFGSFYYWGEACSCSSVEQVTASALPCFFYFPSNMTSLPTSLTTPQCGAFVQSSPLLSHLILASPPANPLPSPHPHRDVTSRTLQLQMKKEYSADWIDLLSSDTYASPSFPKPCQIVPPRSGGVAFISRDRIFAFGGYAEDDVKISEEMSIDVLSMPNRYVVNELWEFSPYDSSSTSWGWNQIKRCDGYVPGPRLATAISTHGSSYAVLLGGWDPQEPGTGGVILDDVSVLDLDSLEWSRPTDVDGDEVATVPGGATSRHIAVTIVGGEEEEDVILVHNHRCEDHVLICSIDTKDEGDSSKVCATWKHQATSGNAPSSRGLHCAATLNDGKTNESKAVVIFGGAAKDGSMSNEAFVLDTITWKWTKLDCSGEMPSPRAGACLCSVDEDTVLLFGGAKPGDGGLVGLNDIWTLRVDTKSGKASWTRLVHNTSADGGNGCTSPPGRNAATLTRMNANVLPKEVWKRESNDAYFLLQGGWYPFRKTYNDVFVLRVSEK
jgi:hypothetical protein